MTSSAVLTRPVGEAHGQQFHPIGSSHRANRRDIVARGDEPRHGSRRLCTPATQGSGRRRRNKGVGRRQGSSVITTVEVLQTVSPVYVARAYEYDLYATCWNRRGAPQPRYVRKVGTARIPGNGDDLQLRVPPEERTTFTFSDPVAMLAAPVLVRPLSWPMRLSPGLLRVHVMDWTVTVTHGDSSTDTARGVADVTCG